MGADLILSVHALFALLDAGRWSCSGRNPLQASLRLLQERSVDHQTVRICTEFKPCTEFTPCTEFKQNKSWCLSPPSSVPYLPSSSVSITHFLHAFHTFQVLFHAYCAVVPAAPLPGPPLPLAPGLPGPAYYGPIGGAAGPWLQLALYIEARLGMRWMLRVKWTSRNF